MTLTSQAVRKVAVLARLQQEPSEEFINQFKDELDKILAYADKLLALKIQKTARNERTVTVSQLRLDEPEPDQDFVAKKRQAILKNFPRSQGDLLILPGIFHDN